MPLFDPTERFTLSSVVNHHPGAAALNRSHVRI
jgi:hypothetical protein